LGQKTNDAICHWNDCPLRYFMQRCAAIYALLFLSYGQAGLNSTGDKLSKEKLFLLLLFMLLPIHKLWSGVDFEDFCPDDDDANSIFEKEFRDFELRNALLINPEYRTLLHEFVVTDKSEEFEQKVEELTSLLINDEKKFIDGKGPSSQELFSRFLNCLRFNIENSHENPEKIEKQIQLLGKLSIIFSSYLSDEDILKSATTLQEMIIKRKSPHSKSVLDKDISLGIIRRSLETYAEIFLASKVMVAKKISSGTLAQETIRRQLKNLYNNFKDIYSGLGESKLRQCFMGIQLIVEGDVFVKNFGENLFDSFVPNGALENQRPISQTQKLKNRQRNLLNLSSVQFAFSFLAKTNSVFNEYSKVQGQVRALPIMKQVYGANSATGFNPYLFFKAQLNQLFIHSERSLQLYEDVIDYTLHRGDNKVVPGHLRGRNYVFLCSEDEDNKLKDNLDTLQILVSRSSQGQIIINQLAELKAKKFLSGTQILSPSGDLERIELSIEKRSGVTGVFKSITQRLWGEGRSGK